MQRTCILHELQLGIIGKKEVFLHLFSFNQRGGCPKAGYKNALICLYAITVSSWLPSQCSHLLKTNLGLPCPSQFCRKYLLSSTILKVGEIPLLCASSSEQFSLTFYIYSTMQEMPASGCIYFSSVGVTCSYLYRKWFVCRSQQIKLIIQPFHIDSEVHLLSK